MRRIVRATVKTVELEVNVQKDNKFEKFIKRNI